MNAVIIGLSGLAFCGMFAVTWNGWFLLAAFFCLLGVLYTIGD